MQAQAAELNEKIETVNRERKYHQVLQVVNVATYLILLEIC